ncbi:MAG: response regulator [Candidatus Omnitrophica bacterium]|nr:response regulator [Candidatus Omnitrophota bacterium]
MPKILLVDDETQLITMVQMRLEANGYEVITASDGQEGLEKAKSESPDLIMMDVMMPKMDGYKACGLLKNDTRYAKIPIILFTARAQQDDQEVGKEVGADAYITKPFEPPVLLAKIKELLDKTS